MEPKGFHRKLTAILSADVAGYSRLMQDDEAATVKTLEAYKQIISDLIKQHRGRVVDSPGDNLLAEFASVVDAVQCAVASQKELQARNAELPENRKMQFRIGVNLGDVIEEDSRIYGDGVNIAARLESIADPGGVCISKTAFDQIETKLPLGYEYLGEKSVKNIAKPVGAYRVILEPRVTKKRGAGFKAQGMGWRLAFYGLLGVVIVTAAAAVWQFMQWPILPPKEKADTKKMAYPLPDKPSIAIMPFVNMSDDPKQEFFSDGITDEIITALSKLSQLFVIARNSTFTYKGKPTSAKQVSEALGIRYVLEGSVRRDGDRVRITEQLVDALTGHQLWTERYDRDLKDIFFLQDEITMKIVTELRVKLTAGESARLAAKGTKNLDAYLKALEAADQLGRWTKDSNLAAKRLAEEAIALDPEYHLGYLLLSLAQDADVFFGTTESPQRSINKGIELAKKAISLDESNGVAYGQLGLLYIRLKEYDKAVEQAVKGAPLGPNNFETNRMAAQVLARTGKVEDALPLLDNAMRQNPVPRYTFLIAAGSMYHQAKHYEKALEIYKKAAQLEPENTGGYVGIAATSSMMGKTEEARAAIGELHRVDPNYSLENVRRTLMLRGDKDQVAVNRFIEGLRMAGIPERPPLPLADNPSIAVLPFANMSNDPEQEYFCDGIADQIINSIANIPYIEVIARNSSFAYKGKSVNVQQIAKDLGVRYILEGSLQRDNENVRINTQLIDAKTGRHLWAEHYDRSLADIFLVQDEICKNIMIALQVKLTVGELARTVADTVSIRAYEKYLKSLEHLLRRTKEDVLVARQLAQEAIAIDPKYASAYSLIWWCYVDEVWFGMTNNPAESIAKAEEMAEKAVSIHGLQGEENSLLSSINLLKKDLDKAISYAEKALEQRPNSALDHFILGMALRYNGQYDEAISRFKKAIQLNPVRPLNYLNNLAWAYLFSKQYEKAIPIWNETLERNPDYLFAYLGLTIAYELSGSEGQAQQAAKHVLRINPKFSMDYWDKQDPTKDKELKKQNADALRKAGLK